MAITDVLDRERIVATHNFNRWLIPPAALAVHLCIGQVYATSVYKTSMVAHFGTSQTATDRPLGSPVSRGRRPSVPIQGSKRIGSGRARRQGSRHPSVAATENNTAGPPVRLPA